MAPRARWLPSSSSQQRALLPWVFVRWTHAAFEGAAHRTECVVGSAYVVVDQQTMNAADELLLIRRTPACTVVQTCGLRGDSSVGGRGDDRVCAARRRGLRARAFKHNNIQSNATRWRGRIARAVDRRVTFLIA